MTDLLTLELQRLAWSDFDRRLANLKRDHSAFVEKIERLRVEHHREAGVANNAPASPGGGDR